MTRRSTAKWLTALPSEQRSSPVLVVPRQFACCLARVAATQAGLSIAAPGWLTFEFVALVFAIWLSSKATRTTVTQGVRFGDLPLP